MTRSQGEVPADLTDAIATDAQSRVSPWVFITTHRVGNVAVQECRQGHMIRHPMGISLIWLMAQVQISLRHWTLCLLLLRTSSSTWQRHQSCAPRGWPWGPWQRDSSHLASLWFIQEGTPAEDKGQGSEEVLSIFFLSCIEARSLLKVPAAFQLPSLCKEVWFLPLYKLSKLTFLSIKSSTRCMSGVTGLEGCSPKNRLFPSFDHNIPMVLGEATMPLFLQSHG